MCQRGSAADEAVSAARLRLRFVSAAAEQKYWELMQLRIRWLSGGAFKFDLALERADAVAQMAVGDKRSASVLRGCCRCRNSKRNAVIVKTDAEKFQREANAKCGQRRRAHCRGGTLTMP